MSTDKDSLADVERLYTTLRRIRRVEEEIARIYPSDRIKSPVHLSIGQEVAVVGVIDALSPSDVVSASYRSHATYLAKGGDLKAMMAELFGRETGCARGKGGSMHLIAMDVHMLGASAVVGTHIPQAVGYALALKREERSRLAAVFFGDGATEEGVFYESLNFASLRKLPVLFVCENNGFAIHTPLSKRWATERLCERVETFGIPTARVTDPDVFALRAVTDRLIAPVRAGRGPSFIEVVTYRWREHVGPGEDYDAGYRSRSDLELWRGRDEVERLGARLESDERRRIDTAIESEIAEAIRFADESPFPAAHRLYEDVYAE